MPVTRYQIPGGMQVTDRQTKLRVFKAAGEVELYTCEHCGRPAGFSTGRVQGRPGLWFCGYVAGEPRCLTSHPAAVEAPPRETLAPPVPAGADLFGAPR